MKGVLTILMTLIVMGGALVYAPYATNQDKQNELQGDHEGSALFLRNCARCHGKDGRAKTFKAKFNHARDLTNPNWQASTSDEHMFVSISKGKGKMPAFQRILSGNEIAALVTYVRMLKKE